MTGETLRIEEVAAPAAPPAEHHSSSQRAASKPIGAASGETTELPTPQAERRSKDGPLEGPEYLKRHSGDAERAAEELLADTDVDRYAKWREAADLEPEARQARRDALAREIIEEREALQKQLDPQARAAEQARAEQARTGDQQFDRGVRDGEINAQLHEQMVAVDAAHRQKAQQYINSIPPAEREKAYERAELLAQHELPRHIEHIIRSAEHGVEIEQRLAEGLEKLYQTDPMRAFNAMEEIKNMDPAVIQQEIRYWDGMFRGNREWRNLRKVTKAPPPPGRLTGGGTAPPSDLQSIADRGDMDSFAAQRDKAEERRGYFRRTR